MIKKLLYLLFFLPLLSFAQDIDRVIINGKISAPQGEDVEGVSIYNISAQRGTVSDKDGNFEILVGENDRVQITALQFQTFTVIVDEGVINSKQMRIYLNPAINQLQEVIVRPYDLSGNIRVDVGRIKTVNFDEEISMDYEDVEFNYGFIQDAQTSIQGNASLNALYNNQQRFGLNIRNLAGLLFQGKDKKNTSQKLAERGAVTTNLRQRFSDNYISRTFAIPEEKAGEFLIYLEESGIDAALLKAENEIELLQFMYEKVVAYKKRGE